MKNYLLIILLLGLGFLSSCEDEEPVEETNPITFTFDKDGTKSDYSGNCSWFDDPDYGTPYYISGWQSDDHNFKITLPKLEVNKWTQAVDSTHVKLKLVLYGFTYTSSNGEESDYTVEITKYDKESGRLEGTFSGKLSYFNVYSWTYNYTNITNGTFVVDED